MIGESLALAAMLMFATNILVTKAASARLDVGTGFVISVVVNLLVAALAFAIELALRGDRIEWDLTGVVLFALAGVCATYLGRFFFFGAIAKLGATKASLFHVSSPAFTALIAWVFIGESLRWPTVVAIVATMIGLLLIIVPSFDMLLGRGESARAAMALGAKIKVWLASGFVVGVGATLAYSVGNVLRGASVRQWNEPIAGAMLGAAAALLLQLAFGSHRQLSKRLRDADRAGKRLYAVGGVLTITAQMCMIASMRYIPVAVATVITLCTPLIVIPASYWLMRSEERIGLRTLAGAALTIAGMAIIVLR
ncbi:MAG TPA: DMT family transporter [Casimicrobiaceae bacterium]|nr:DMT family transporter [Casimicrobiaceae bacterium]